MRFLLPKERATTLKHGLIKRLDRVRVPPMLSTKPAHVSRSPSRRNKRGVDLISDALPFGRLWYGETNAVSNAIGYAIHRSRSHDAVIRVYDDAGNVIETHKHAGEFKEF